MNLNKNIIKNWDLNERTINVLVEEGIITIGDLLAISPSYLLKFRNFGQKSLDDIIYNLEKENLTINEHLINWIKYLNLNKLNSEQQEIPSEQEKYLHKNIDELEISSETSSDLQKQKIYTLYDLFKNSSKDRNGKLHNPRLHKKTLMEIEELVNNNFYSNVKKISNEDYKNFNINIIKEWPISARTSNVLISQGIFFLGQLLNCPYKELLKLKNFGKKSIDELEFFLAKLNYTFGTYTGEWKPPLQNDNEFQVDNNFILSKSIFKDKFEIKKRFLEQKIFITLDMSEFDVEKLIIEDINEIINSLNEKYQNIFKSRFAFETQLKTLEVLAKEYSVTRERVRQYESKLIRNISKLGKIHKLSLVKFLLNKENNSLHRIFPNLDRMFFDTKAKSGKFFNTSGDSLIYFLEIFCDVEHGFFKPPEVVLMNFNKDKIKNIFIETPFPILKEFFIEELKINYGYDNFMAKAAFDYMVSNNIIIKENNRIYPVNISKNLEVANILLSFPEGLTWKEIVKIGKNSPTKNDWNLNRGTADSSISMEYNPQIYLSNRGTFKNIKYLRYIEKKDEIINCFINEIKKNGKNEAILELVYKTITEKEEFNDLDFYDARAIIKLYGEEQGLFHSGASGKNILSLSKGFTTTNVKNEIFNIINNHHSEITLNEIEDIFYREKSSKKKLYLSTKLNLLVDEEKIFKINPGVFINYEDGINMCDIKEINNKIKEIISDYEFLTLNFLRELLNESLGYNLSSLYYSSLLKNLANKNYWFYDVNYLSDKSEKKISLENFIQSKYDKNKDTLENFLNISKIIGISKKSFDAIIYNNNLKFDTSWMNDD